MTPTTFFNLLAACLVSSTVPSSIAYATAFDAAHHLDLFGRANSQCATSGYLPCNIAGLPENFCCPSSQKCLAFNNNKSAICCPAGQDCKTIAPLSCDISKQNATSSPASQLHSTDLTGHLATCGSQCCPQGYSCQNNNCVLVSTSSTAKVSSTASSTLSTSKPTSTTTGSAKATTASATSTPSSSPQNTTLTTAHCNNFPVTAVLAGFFPGLALGILLTIAIICLCGRRKAKAAKKSSSSVFSSPTATVSDPIYQNDALRTDFLRREPRNIDSGGTVPGRTSRVRSLFSRSPTLPRHDDGFSAQNIQGTGRGLQTPMRTPEMRREPSMESIKIYSPPSMTANAAGARQTTFTDMMKEAGFRPGQPYIGSPRRVRAHSPTSVYSRGFWSNVRQ